MRKYSTGTNKGTSKSAHHDPERAECPPSGLVGKLGRLKKGVFLAHRSVHRSEDETAFQFGEGYGREGRQGHPPGDTQAVFGGGKDPDRFGRPARRGQHRRACRREGIAQNLYYRWSKDFLEAGKKRLAGDTACAATSDEVKDLRRGRPRSRRLSPILPESAGCGPPACWCEQAERRHPDQAGR